MPEKQAVYDKVIVKRTEKGDVEYVVIHDTKNHTIAIGKFVPLDMDEHLELLNK